jgi:hypothetical protein
MAEVAKLNAEGALDETKDLLDDEEKGCAKNTKQSKSG